MKTAAEPQVKRILITCIQGWASQARSSRTPLPTVYGQKELLAASQQVHASTEGRDRGCHRGLMTRSATGTAQDLSSLDEDDTLVQATSSRRTLQSKKLQWK